MSFPASAPPSGPRPSRSTPIPGVDGSTATPISAVPGNWDATRPPTPTEFVSGRGVDAAPVAPGFAPPPGASGPFEMPGMGVPFQMPKRRRSMLGVVLTLLVFAGPLIGVGVGVWAFLHARDAMEDADELSNSLLSDRDREELGLPEGVQTLFDAGAAPALIAAFQEAIGGPATRFAEVLIYPDYAFAEAQDPTIPSHLDEYSWRSGEVGDPQPEPNDPQLESQLFGSADVDWTTIATVASAAPALLSVEQGEVSHIIVDRWSFATGSSPVVVRVYVSGPRGGGYLEADPLTGEVLATH